MDKCGQIRGEKAAKDHKNTSRRRWESEADGRWKSEGELFSGKGRFMGKTVMWKLYQDNYSTGRLSFQQMHLKNYGGISVENCSRRVENSPGGKAACQEASRMGNVRLPFI